jgi:hypothetical protein
MLEFDTIVQPDGGAREVARDLVAQMVLRALKRSNGDCVD